MRDQFDFTRRLQAVSDRDVGRLAEHFLDPARRFDAASLGDHLLFPEEMAWFYGEPIHRDLSEEQRLMLNRLTFCQSYLSTLVAEAATNVLNYEAVVRAFLHDDPDVALYMAREVVEETVHLEAFLIVIRKVLGHYGLTFEDLRAANVSLKMAGHYSRFHSLIGWLHGDMNLYYFTRFPLNVNQKTVERCSINEPRLHPEVRAILKNHAIDEARHMQMSRETGKVALRRMRRWQRNVACAFYAHFASRLHIGRHVADGALTRATRVRTLTLCGVPAGRAERAYDEWRDRVNQPQDPPLVAAGRLYYLRQNLSYIDELAVSDRVKRRMKRRIESGYRDLTRAGPELRPLELGELTRSG